MPVYKPVLHVWEDLSMTGHSGSYVIKYEAVQLGIAKFGDIGNS